MTTHALGTLVDRPRRQNGATVQNGLVRYWSASSLTLGDPSTGEGCPRKWAYEKLFGRKPPETAQQGVGKELHFQNETYLRTGVNIMGSLAMRGKHMVPTPGDDLLVEADLVVPLEVEARAREVELSSGSAAADQIRLAAPLESAPLRLLGIPVVGYADLIHARCLNQGASDVEDTLDPPNTVEVVDWKTTSSLKWVKSPSEVSRTTQMTVYGKWVLEEMPWAEHVRLSHGYYLTMGSATPRKVSLRVLPETIERQWEHVESIGRLLTDVARETNVDQIPANRAACSAFRGCPHLSVCRAGAQQGLVTYFGAAGAARIAAAASGRTTGTGATVTLGNKGGLLAIGAKSKPAAAESNPEDLAAEIRRLAAEEARVKYPGLQESWEQILGTGLGTPILSGAFARAVADLTGVELFGGILAGSGQFKNSGPFEDPAMIGPLTSEIMEFAKSGAAEPVDARPLPQVVPDQAVTENELLLEQLGVGEDPARLAAEETAKRAAEPAKPAKTRAPRRSKPVEDPSVMHDSEALKIAAKIVEAESATTTVVNVNNVNNTAPETVFFYIDAAPMNVPHQSYWPKIFSILEQMSREAGIPDVRRPPAGHDLSFGAWKYALDLVLQTFPVPPGHWTLETTGTDLCRIVVEAVTRLVPGQGGILVLGASR